MTNIFFAFFIGYLLGSFPSGLVLLRILCGIDIREYGSKNIGTTNVFRTVGARMAILVLLFDVLKGIVAVLLVRTFFTPSLELELLAAIGALLGHNYSLFLGLKGGRGVATGLGLIILFMPDVCLITFLVWLTIVYFTRYVSLASILGALVTPIMAYIKGYPIELVLFAALAGTFIILRHLENIKRLLAGTETKIKQGSLNKLKNDKNK
ncbi:MAG TPA: glycerol-3-phosphate 1-O-acyltransferase PlsY [Candidatus Avacidaminococcus intestinavium]|uniref:Glycerol-3-phosphate acyltransferase n=1 Tax=Candidatus Avacidaminococcus intestinavium TaxID=2840684 RepID=A0A9D1SLE9_9FIRM|nr:glycerol-3-phosphate 1-O-acyltransferase PlsY [Candidatus Avacidaminococcus intestinavium]